MKNILPSIALALIAGLTGSQAADNVTTSNTTSTSTTSSSGLGYGNITSTLPSNSTFSFGSRYAILNLDLINGIVGSFNTTPAGQAFINSTSQWIDAVQSKSNSSSGSYDPLTIYTRIYFSTLQRPELGLGVPFSNIAQGFGNITESSETGELYPAFAEKVLDTDVVLQKTRFYAGAGNGLEEILRANKIDTVVLSGVRTSGVILTTAIRLYDLDYNVYIISDNVIETPPDNGINTSILEEIFPKFVGMQVISLEQAKGALERSQV